MKNIDWNHLRAFHTTADTGSLSAAARQLGLTQPTLSRQIAALEADLDVALFERPGRRLVLTQTGLDLLNHIATMGDAAQAFTLAASGRIQEISGRVCISATDSFSTYILPSIVERIKSEAPQLTIVIVAANDLADLHQMEADLAIRHARPERAGLMGEHIRDANAYFYASKEWVTRNGLPTKPADMAKTGLIGFGDTARLSSYLCTLGIPMEAADFRIISDSAVVVWEMVKRGMGVAAMLQEVAKQTSGIVKLLPDMAPICVPIWLVSHRELQASPRIRLVHKILAEELARL